jgi:integrase
MAAVYTGGRLRELLSLRWRDVDESAGIVVFRRETTKSGRERIVPLREELLGALRTLKRGGPEDRVFNYRGTGLTTIRTAFENARDKAGLPDVHFHDLRHTFASGYVQRGGDIYRLQRFLGHSTPRLTERYVHLSTQFLRDGGQYIGLPKAAWEPAAEGHAGAPEKPDSAPAEKPSPSSWGDWESSSSAL